MAGFDFTKAKQAADEAEAGLAVAINDEDGTPYDPPLVITVAGMVSRRVRIAQSRNAFAFAGKREAAEGNEDAALDVTAEAVETGTLEVAARATLAWEGLTAEGQVVPCTLANARELYRVAPHIHTQVLRAMRSRDAAFRGAGTVADGVDSASGDDGAARGEQDDTGAPAIARGARGRKKSSRAETA
jgi:hypothetical protein